MTAKRESMASSRICIFGAGAIGGLLGARLSAVGAAVSLVARGAHGAAIREQGLRLVAAGGDTVVRPLCTDDPKTLGPQEIVILAVKAPALRDAADAIRHLLGPHTVLVAAVNGVPWWYFHGLAGPFADRRLASVDPDGTLWEKLPPQRTIGCVAYAASEIVAPGVVRQISGQKFVLGDPTGALGGPTAALSRLLTTAGFDAPISSDIRQELWNKLWGNLAFNPLSVLTGARLDQLARDPDSREAARHMLGEAREVGLRLGVKFPTEIDRRIAAVEAYGPHKTSMLQDFERGRPLELDALLGAVVEMARLVEVATPVCDIVLGLVRQRARLGGCYPG
jgi:2-dehydropantoate 2-reductase